jgi:3,4-dihydroxy 2-butanone 4-phosphate synthase/GTP cyclohydrolase II
MQETSIVGIVEKLAQGEPVILFDDVRELEGDLAFAGRFATPELVNLCLQRARGLLCVVMWPADAIRMGVSRLPHNGNDHLGTPFGVPISLANGTSGVSASTRAATIRATAGDEGDRPTFVVPGHVSTLIGHSDGLAGRYGHTEGILELLRYAGISGTGVLCEILGPSGEVATASVLQALAAELQVPMIRLDDVLRVTAGRSR